MIAKRAGLWICLGLALGTLALYLRTAWLPFIDFDDNRYLTENPIVQGGLSWRSAGWAFSTLSVSNWHPLTWLSFMLDVQLFGLSPGPMHLENALLHALNAALVFLALRRMTGEPGRSALVAALFAAHPLRVESVAWIAERKDALSSLFGLGALYAWILWTERQAALRYAAVIALFALSLLAKPMWVTFPFLLLLLDHWPLRRGRRIAEKLPLFALSLGSSIVTAVAQQGGGAMTGSSELGPGARIANALVSYALYLWKTVWPWPLAIHYPHPGEYPAWQVAVSALLLAAITAAAVALRREKPWLLTGWLWFAGALVPMIGLVQVGAQSMADRYAYLPHIGLFFALVWTLRAPVAVNVGAVAALCVVTFAQLGYWKSHTALFEHSLAISPDDAIAHGALSQGLRREGKLAQALPHAEEAVRLSPGNPRHWNNLGAIEYDLYREEDGIRDVRRAIELEPAYQLAWRNLGQFQVDAGHVDDGVVALAQALRLAPEDAQTRFLLGNGLLRQGRPEEGIAELRESVRLRPRHAPSWNLLGIALQGMGKPAEAIDAFRNAARADAGNYVLWRNLGIALVKAGRATEAVEAFTESLRLKPADADVLARLQAARRAGP